MQTINNISAEEIKHHFSYFFENSSACSNVLVPLLKALRWNGELRYLLASLPHKVRNLELPGLLYVLKTLHYEHKSFAAEINQLDTRLLPCLFVTQDNKVLLLSHNEKRETTVYDADEERYLPYEQVGQLSGICYLFYPAEKKAVKSDTAKSWLRSMIKRYRTIFFNIFFVSAFINLSMLAVPLFVMVIYDKFISTGYYSMLFGFTLGLFIALLSGFILQKIRGRVLSYISSRLDFIIGNEIIKRILYLPVSYTEMASVSAQINRIKDFDHTREAVTNILTALFFDVPFFFIFILAIALIGNIYIALVPLVLLFILYLTALLFRLYFKYSLASSLTFNAQYQNFLLEAFNQLNPLKGIGAVFTWKKRHRELLAETVYQNYRADFFNELSQIFANQSVVLSGLVILVAGALAVFQNALTVGGLVATMILTWRIVAPFRMMFLSLSRTDQIINSIQQINNLMQIPIERDPELFLPALRHIGGNIALQQVAMRYARNLEPALLNINLQVEVGSILGVVGRNGSGKSTLLKIIMGLYPIDSGAILIDDINIKQLDPNQLRLSISYVSQKLCFFYGSIMQNMLLAKPEATVEEISAALQLANVYQDIIALPEGLKTMMTDQYEQQFPISLLQRLSIARALLKDPKILLLDQTFNGFDFQQDQAFIAMLQQLKGKMTIIMVTERPSHLKIADQILILEAGRMAGVGPAQEVLPKLMQVLQR